MTTHKTIFPLFLATIGLVVFSPLALCLEPTHLVTYGSKAQTIEGDDDFLQVLFIRVPESLGVPFYIRLFDADCGGNLDARYTKEWDTLTRFRLFGGKGAYSTPGLRRPTPTQTDLEAGKLLADETFGEDPFKDSRWHTFAKVLPEQGEKRGGFRYVKLVIEGKAGDDGNRFSVAVSLSPRRNRPPDGLSIFSYTPSIHLPRSDVFAEMRFFVPKDEQTIIAHNFDSSQAFVGVDTAFRANLPVSPSGQDEWAHSSVLLNKDETGRMAALRFAGGREIPNDGTFYVTDAQGNLLPIGLPVHLQKPNSRPEPRVEMEPLEDCNSFLFDGSRTLDPDGDAMSFSWNFGDGHTGTGERITHRYDAPGRYEASVMVSDASGQISNSSLRRFTVTVNHPPVSDAGLDRIAAPRETLAFDASASSDLDGELIHYVWDFGDGHRSQGVHVRHTYRRPDVYVVTLRVTDNSGSPCNFATDECEIWINAKPVVNIGPDRIASAEEEMAFSGANIGDSDGKIIAYEWNMGDGVKKSGREVSHIYEKPGTYTVRLDIADDAEADNSTAHDTLKVFVNDPPVADAGEDQRAAVGETVRFDGSDSFDPDGELIEFIWNFGDDTMLTLDSALEPVTHAYEEPGEYLMTLTVRDSSGSSSDMNHDQMTVIVNDPPIADAGLDQWVTSSEVEFDGSGSTDRDGEITRYLWDFGDSTTGEGPQPRHIYGFPGTYLVRLTVTDDSGTSTHRTADDMQVIVNHLPIADAGPDRVGVPGQAFIFDASGSLDPDGDIRSFQWDFGDGGRSQKLPVQDLKFQKVSHRFPDSGRYNVFLTVYDNTGHENAVGFDEAVIIVNASPVAKAAMGEGASGQRPAASSDHPLPLATRRPPPAHCPSPILLSPNEPIQLDGTQSYDPDGQIVSYQWTFSDVICKDQDSGEFECRKPLQGTGNKPQTSSIKHQAVACRFAEPGIYEATLTVVDNSRVENAVAQDQIVIRVNHRPEADAGKNIHTNERTVLLDGSGSTDADGDPLIHLWNFGDSSPLGRGEKVFHTYPKGGSYPVILYVNDGTDLENARATASVRVKVNEPPIADAGKDKTVCSGKVVIFDGVGSLDPEGGVMKYHWDFGDGAIAEGVNPTKTYDKGGVWLVTLTVTDDSGLAGGDTDTDQITVTVIESPLADAGPDQAVCAGAIVQFDGTRSRDIDGLVNSYDWDFGDGTTGGGPTPMHVYAKADLYRVRLVITGDRMADCDNTEDDEMIVTVHAAPTPEFTCPVTAERGRPVSFGGRAARGERRGESGERRKESGEGKVAITPRPSPLTPRPAPRAPRPRGKWVWGFGDWARDEGEKTEHIFEKAGDYVVTLTVTSDSETDCNRTSVQKRIRINAPPIAKAGDDRLVGVHQPVRFDGSASTDPDGVISSYQWNFGDGRTGTGVQTRHQYEKPGRYEVRLRVTDNTDLANNSDTDPLMVTVNHAPEPVITVLNCPETDACESPIYFQSSIIPLCAGEEIVLSGRDSEDPDGDEMAGHTWHFGDGSPVEKGEEVAHAWHFTGSYGLVLEIDDGRKVNNSRAQTSALVLVNEPPVADGGPDRVVSIGQKVVFDGSASRDRDGDILSFRWQFGDGQSAEGERVSHLFQTPGQYKVCLFVADDSGSTCDFGEDAITIRVNSPPVADAGGDREAFTGGAHDALIFDASRSHDPDGDPLAFLWEFGDGDSAQGQKVSHVYEKPGTYTVRLRVDDGTGLKSGVSSDQITVHVRRRE